MSDEMYAKSQTYREIGTKNHDTLFKVWSTVDIYSIFWICIIIVR